MRRMSLGVCLGVVLGLTLSNVIQPTAVQGQNEKKADQRVYEARTYIAAPGKLAELNARFRDHTLKFFEKHGMKNVIYLTPTDAPQSNNTLVYLISHESREQADKNWAAFKKDPEWLAAAKKSEENGKLVAAVKSEYFVATDYSPIK
ncbi:MAG: NIPSNAP family protein [Planctomycetota bacterium]